MGRFTYLVLLILSSSQKNLTIREFGAGDHYFLAPVVNYMVIILIYVVSIRDKGGTYMRGALFVR